MKKINYPDTRAEGAGKHAVTQIRDIDGKFLQAGKVNEAASIPPKHPKREIMAAAAEVAIEMLNIMVGIARDIEEPGIIRLTAARTVTEIAHGKPGIRKDPHEQNFEAINRDDVYKALGITADIIEAEVETE